jgi:phosphatidate cytidylyltransferase
MPPLDASLRAFAPLLGILFLATLPLLGLATRTLASRQPARVRELWLRYLAWLAIAGLVLGALTLGRTAWVALVALVARLSYREYGRAVGLATRDRALYVVGALIVVVAHAAAWVSGLGPAGPDGVPAPGRERLFLGLPVVATLALLAVPIVRDRFAGATENLGLALFGVLHLGWLAAHLGVLGDRPGSVGLVLWVTFLVCLHDVAAFACGKLAGRHPLRATLSPRKTWEGALGAALAVGLAAFALRWLVPAASAAHLAVLSALVTVSASVGDLGLAAIKRDRGLKDWGACLPGHGGILDRTNSLIPTAALVVHYTRVVAG